MQQRGGRFRAGAWGAAHRHTAAAPSLEEEPTLGQDPAAPVPDLGLSLPFQGRRVGLSLPRPLLLAGVALTDHRSQGRVWSPQGSPGGGGSLGLLLLAIPSHEGVDFGL